jgi:Spy/CpxP family protein refolding chaperone
MRTRKLIIAALIACSSLTAFAQKKDKDKTPPPVDSPAPPRDHPGRMDLSEEQRKKMKEIHMKSGKEIMTLKNQAMEKKAHLKTLTTADKPDMNEINKTIDEMSALNAQIMKKKTAAKMEVRGLLTDEQRLQFDMKGDKMKGKKMKKGPGMHGTGKDCHDDRD